MALTIRNIKIETLARSIAAREGLSITAVILSALENYERKLAVEFPNVDENLALKNNK